MKRSINFLGMILMIACIFACNRSVEFDTNSTTPPTYTIVSHHIKGVGERIESAKVNIYKNIDLSTVVYERSTDKMGYVTLTNAEMLLTFPEPTGLDSRGGKLFVESESLGEILYGEGESRYINMTDGETMHWIPMDTTLIRISVRDTIEGPYTIYFFKSKSDRESNNAEIVSMTSSLTGTDTLTFFRKDITDVIYKKPSYIYIEGIKKGKVYFRDIDISKTAGRHEHFGVVLDTIR